MFDYLSMLINKNCLRSKLIVFAGIFPTITFAASAWLPEPGRLDLSLGLSGQFYDQLWQGTKKTDLPGNVNLNFLYVGYVYGITENLATDFVTGYSYTHSTFGNRGDLGGLYDLNAGLLYRFVNEASHQYIPTLTVRLGGTLSGTYALAYANNLQSPGDGVDGSQISILAGKSLPHGFAVFGEAGYRYRGSVVPNAYFGNIGVLQNFVEHWSWNLSYQWYQALFGIDIGSPPFTGRVGRFGFQATQEQSSFLNGGITYTFTAGQSLSFVYARTIAGKNTAVSDVVSLFVTIPIQTRATTK